MYCICCRSDVVTAPASTTPKAAQELLKKTKKGRLPLVNDKGQLVSDTIHIGIFLLKQPQPVMLSCVPQSTCLHHQ